VRLGELLHDLEYSGTTDLPLEEMVTCVTDDSRKVSRGAVFVCVKGARFDGHTMAREALAAGALCVVAQKKTGADREIITKNTRAAYASLCAAFFGYPARKLKLIGVTGTNGKTTIAFLLKEIFDAAGYKTGLIGTLVNMVGTESKEACLTTPDPWELHGLFARMAEEGCAYCFMEVSSQALAQDRVCGLTFEAAIFTNLTQDHLDYHGSFQAYASAKQRLFRQTKFAVVNLDDSASETMVDGSNARVVTYSIREMRADYTAKNVQYAMNGVVYELVGRQTIGRLRFAVPGAFSVYNSMAAACTAVELGLDLHQTLTSLAQSRGVRGRMEVVPVDTGFTVLIDYAHTPDGLENILKALQNTAKGRILLVFGCGGDRDKTKRPIMGKIAQEYANIVIVSSDNPRSEDPLAIIADILAGMKHSNHVHTEPDRIKAIALALKLAKKDDVVVLAGKGQETYQILASGKIHLDEREVVRNILGV
jgi:UDP-N-acetylmuramoyl-L-alanyl-D-glutamate--2,6-diaminopimelate ligase